jgi:hypothetical protein
MTICNSCGTDLANQNARRFLCEPCQAAIPAAVLDRYRIAANAVARFRKHFKRHEAPCPEELLGELAAAWTDAAGIARQRRSGAE